MGFIKTEDLQSTGPRSCVSMHRSAQASTTLATCRVTHMPLSNDFFVGTLFKDRDVPCPRHVIILRAYALTWIPKTYALLTCILRLSHYE
eukprot:3159098-Amphidinium_carterae.1